MAFLFEYGLFLAKALTLVIAVVAVIAIAVGLQDKGKHKKGEIVIDDLSHDNNDLKDAFLSQTLSKKELKEKEKADKQAAKKAEQEAPKGKLFVIDFNGSVDAHEVNALAKEINAVLLLADKTKDEVLVRLESGGGVVHGYGLGASQLNRLKEKQIPLTIAVDKVAASGGYMMACVADKIVAAPFAILGSIGVIAQIPNFNKVLKKHDVEFEQITAGEYKRTLTMFGENTDSGREKFKQDIEQVHHLFREHVLTARPSLNIEKVATGETWFGSDALELGLVDELKTSDDLLLETDKQVYKVSFKTKKNLADKFAIGLSAVSDKVMAKLINKSHDLYH